MEAILQRIQESAASGLGALRAVWDSRSVNPWPRCPQLYEKLGERTLAKGEPLLAHDVLAKGLELPQEDPLSCPNCLACSPERMEGREHRPRQLRLRQLLALALARSGATLKANGILRQLRQEGNLDEETTAILARTYKDLWEQSTKVAERQRYLWKAHDLYHESFERHRGYYAGINAAATAVFLGQRKKAATLARRVGEICWIALERLEGNREPSPSEQYWIYATLGEAALILREMEEAKRWYGRAVEIGPGDFANLSTTRRQARLLLQHLSGGDSVLSVFRIPRVVSFVGHMVDRPGRPTPRFLPQLEEDVRAALIERLEKLEAGFGYASAACGSDILFLEAMLARKGEINIILPYKPEEFVEDSVDIIPQARWPECFQQVRTRATRP